MSISTLTIEESIKQTKLQMAKTKELWKDVENSEFHEYVWDWYGPGNDSWEFFTETPITMQEVQYAVELYRTIVAPTLFGHSGYSDTFDREITRDILFITKNMCKTNEVEYGHGLKKVFTPTGKLKKKFK